LGVSAGFSNRFSRHRLPQEKNATHCDKSPSDSQRDASRGPPVNEADPDPERVKEASGHHETYQGTNP
jgi:hypothetical protein